MWINNKTTLLINIMIYSDSSSEETTITRTTIYLYWHLFRNKFIIDFLFFTDYTHKRPLFAFLTVTTGTTFDFSYFLVGVTPFYFSRCGACVRGARPGWSASEDKTFTMFSRSLNSTGAAFFYSFSSRFLTFPTSSLWLWKQNYIH
jgi:hypothetical protein